MADHASEFFEGESQGELNQRLPLFEAVKQRCGAAGIAVEEAEGWVDDGPCLVVRMPCGRGVRKITLDLASEAESFLAIEFGRYRFIPGYDAVLRPDTGELEAQLRVIGSASQNGMPPPGTFSRLFEREGPASTPPAPPAIPSLSQAARQPEPPSICLPTCSAGLTRLRESWRDMLMPPAGPVKPVSEATTP